LSLLGISLSQYLQLKSVQAANGVQAKAKAQACILLWLEGGPSHIDTWDPKSNSNFKPIPTNVPGIQISELLPRVAKQMDKLSIVRSMHTEEDNHPQGTYYALTGHRPNPAMQFPSFGSILSKEMGARNNLPPTSSPLNGTKNASMRNTSKALSWAQNSIRWWFLTPAAKTSKLPISLCPSRSR
jgi:hypothetical protein